MTANTMLKWLGGGERAGGAQPNTRPGAFDFIISQGMQSVESYLDRRLAIPSKPRWVNYHHIRCSI